MYAVHPNLGATSTKRVLQACNLYFINGLQSATECCLQISPQILTGSCLREEYFRNSIYPDFKQIQLYLCIFTFLKVTFNLLITYCITLLYIQDGQRGGYLIYQFLQELTQNNPLEISNIPSLCQHYLAPMPSLQPPY